MKRLDAKLLGIALMATILAVLSSCSVLNGTTNGNGDDVYGISTKKQTVTTPAQAQAQSDNNEQNYEGGNLSATTMYMFTTIPTLITTTPT